MEAIVFVPPISADGRLLCRFCCLLIDPQELTFATGHWVIPGVGQQPKYPSHRTCKKEGMKREAYDCQCIDASCNDCKHYQRQGRPESPSPLPRDRRITDEEQYVYLTGAIAASADSFGQCLKYNKRVTTNPNTAEMMPCFEHRRAGEYVVTGEVNHET